MIILKELAEPRWVDMPRGVRLRVTPVTTAVMMAAKTGARQAVECLDEARRGDAALLTGMGFQALLEALAGYAVDAWENVQDASGAALPCSREALALLMRHEDMAEAFFRAVVMPAEAVAAEGNASGPAQPGTSARGRNTAGGATPSVRTVGANAPTKRKRR